MTMKCNFNVFCLLLAIFIWTGGASNAFAQDAGAPKGNEKISIEDIPSLVFTYWQHKSILDAKNTKGVVRAPTQSEMDAIENDGDLAIDPGPREITLAGILFTTPEDWIIWLNGQRVTPSAVPKEVLDLRVFDNYIEIKWLDDYTNQIFPIRMRTHQRFNMDSRIFLPG